MMRYLTTLLGLALILGGPDLAAQQHQHRGDTAQRGMGQARGMMGEGQGMMGGAAIRVFAPAELLSMRADLALTDDQVTQLEQLQADATREHDQAMASHDAYRDRMMEALQSDMPDTTEIHGLMAGAHQSMGDAHWTEMRAALAAMGVLSETQRAQVRANAPGAGMQHRHRQGQR